jgi:hypothetical protein
MELFELREMLLMGPSLAVEAVVVGAAVVALGAVAAGAGDG